MNKKSWEIIPAFKFLFKTSTQLWISFRIPTVFKYPYLITPQATRSPPPPKGLGESE